MPELPSPSYADDWLTIHQGDCRAVLAGLEAGSVHTVVTSPPYWGLRDYGHGDQLGLEPTPEEYVANMVAVFREVRRVLRDDGTLWLNLGDTFASGSGLGRNDAGRDFTGGGGNKPGSGNPGRQGSHDRVTGLKPKDLVGIPWRVAFALQADGWYLRSDIIWAKPNPMPESVTDRPTKSHEYLFLLAKSERYHFDADAVREPLLSSPSDLRKMIESKDRIGGLTKEQDDPLLRASGRTNIGRKRSVGNKQAAAMALDHRRAALHDAADRAESGEQGGRNIRSVWTIATQPYPGAHFATFPPKLVEPCILAGCPEGGTVLDPFGGSGTTAMVAQHLGRRAVLIELNPEYIEQQLRRNAAVPLGLEAARA